MSPKLIAISGTLKGRIFNLTETESLVGREPSNPVCLNDLSVSRRHCVIKSEEADRANDNPTPGPITDGGQPASNSAFTIVDLDSFNGTFVNGLPVKEHALAHGDQIAVGDVVLLFLLHETEAGAKAAIHSNEDNLITRSTIRLRRDEAIYLRPEKILAELPATERVARDLNALIKISTTMNSIRGLEELQRELLELILEVIPAEREAFLLMDEAEDALASLCGWTRINGPDESIRVSQTITSQVLRERVSLLSNDLVTTAGLSQSPSLIEARVCSVLCVPLVILENALGVIYVDTSDPASRFDEGHLQLLTAIAAIAAAPIENARRVEWLEGENQRLREEIHVEHQMIGESAAMRAVYQFIGKVAAADSTVLIRGESGTGKELAARAIHLNSPRRAKAFVAINGATLSETLLESELFGHEKGSFTGAIAQKRGKLEVADGGTLFLDEVGELTSPIQAKLLRVLQEQEFERVGGTRPIKVNVRIVAATNQNLEEAIARGGFRQDLYYRLNVVSVIMPPLRDRREDIQLLASFFSSIFSKKCRRRIQGISPQARAVLRAHDWPGNVRELENAIERAIVLGSTEVIQPEDLPETIFETGHENTLPEGGYHEELKKAKQSIVLKAIEAANGNYTEAAKRLGLHATNLHRLIRNLDLKTQLKK
jgi:Nif-specific regulatory protein